MKNELNQRPTIFFALIVALSGLATHAGEPVFGVAPRTYHNSWPKAQALDDFNGDGRLDMAILQETPWTNAMEISVRLGNGDGTFGAPSIIPVAAGYPLGKLLTGDFNSDGKRDLAFTIDSYTSLSEIVIVFGDGTGNFSGPFHLDNGSAGGETGFDYGDVDEDGNEDFIVGFSGSNIGVNLIQNQGNGTWEQQSLSSIGSPLDLVMGDLNEDGHLDIVILAAGIGGGTSGLVVLPGDGSGNFGTPSVFPAGDGLNGLVLKDATGDGHLDAFITRGGTNDGSVLILKGNGNGTFGSAYSVIGNLVDPYNLAVADFNGDGKLDIAAGSSMGFLAIATGDGMGGFAKAPCISVPGEEIYDLKAGDLDGNGRPDLVVLQSPFVSLVLAKEGGGFAAGLALVPGGAISTSVVADFNADGKSDIAVAGFGLFLGTGAGSFEERPHNTLINGTFMVQADFNGDGKADIAIASSSSDETRQWGLASVFLGDGQGGLGKPDSWELGTDIIPIAAITGDFNEDGKIDLAISTSDAKVYMLFGDGSGSLLPPQAINLPGTATMGELAAADFNGDRHLDLALIVEGSGGGEAALLPGAGDGTFGTAVELSLDNSPVSLVSGDFNGDGFPDLVATGWTSASVLTGHGDGTFDTPTDFPFDHEFTVSGSNFLEVGDFNFDGSPDLVVLASQDIIVLPGNGMGGFMPIVRFPSLGEPSVSAGDFNQDGKLDLASIYIGVITILFNETPGSNTSPGQDVAIVPVIPGTGASPVSLTFAEVTTPGMTTAQTNDYGPVPPANFNMGSPATYYELKSTAVFQGQIEVCIDYRDVAYQDESQLKLFHFESGSWVDRTVSLDTLNNRVCGGVNSLSPFAIFEPAMDRSLSIDILPGKSPNKVKLCHEGKILVAILSTSTFNAVKALRQESLTFGRTGKEKSLLDVRQEDVNHDGRPDLVGKFLLEKTAFKKGDVVGILMATAKTGDLMRGTDSILIVDKGKCEDD